MVDIGCPVKGFPECRIGLIKVGAHAFALASLAGKQKS
jgi:hypothetical protein